MGRIVNFYELTNHGHSKMPRSAKGCIKLVVKDDTGAITVSLLPSREASSSD